MTGRCPVCGRSVTLVNDRSPMLTTKLRAHYPKPYTYYEKRNQPIRHLLPRQQPTPDRTAVNPIDIRDLALNLSNLLGTTGPGRTRFPLLVTRDGEPEAIIIRHEAYAPRLHDFAFVSGGILCVRCPDGPFGPGRIPCDTSSLGVALKAANQHWRDTHREKP